MKQGSLLTNRARSISAAALLLACSALLPAQTPAVSILFNFTGGANGGYPFSTTLVQGTNGEFYGVTGEGGATTTSSGTVFDITPQGSLTTLDSFCCHYIFELGNGQWALMQTSAGVLYGMTLYGGLDSSSNCMTDGMSVGCGTIFQLGPAGQLIYLYSFSGSDGEFPYEPLVQGTDGNLYGTVNGGGAYGYGSVFKFVPGFGLTPVYSFCQVGGPDCPDGSGVGPLVLGADGNFYGVTAGGGGGLPPGSNQFIEGGTVFKLTPQGTLTTLYDFCSQTSCADGEGPTTLMQASNGNLYGTTIEADWASAIPLATTLVVPAHTASSSRSPPPVP